MVGIVDMGKTSKSLAALRGGMKTKIIGTYVLQLMSQGVSGFPFPFAYFVLDLFNATKLYRLVGGFVNKLAQYGFETMYVWMVCTVSNKPLMRLHFPDVNRIENILINCCSWQSKE